MFHRNTLHAGLPSSSSEWGCPFESVFLQASVDRVHLLSILLRKADVQTAGILDLGHAVEVAQGQHQAIVGTQRGDAVIPVPLGLESEILRSTRGPNGLRDRTGQASRVVADHLDCSTRRLRAYATRTKAVIAVAKLKSNLPQRHMWDRELDG